MTGMRNVAIPAVVAISAFVCSNVLNALRPFKPQLAANDSSKCKLHDGPYGAEDLVLARDGWILASSLDGGHYFHDGVDSCGVRENSGGVWALRAASPDPAPASRIELGGFPRDGAPCFQTHGLYLSNATDRLYVVAHRGTYSSVEIFKVGYDSDDRPPSLTWIRSVKSDSLPNMGPNDVVEGADSGELYVTQYIPFGIPHSGRKNPETFMQKMKEALLLPMLFLGLKMTKVHRCTFTDDPHSPATCEDATGGKARFKMANGISKTKDSSTVFVADPLAYSIRTFRRVPETGLLEETGQIELDHSPDNIEWKEDVGENGALWMGIIPDVVVVAKNDALPREECYPVPGGLAEVTRGTDGPDVWNKQHVIFNHDGSMLSQVSSGMVYGGRIFLGSPHASGILVCEE